MWSSGANPISSTYADDVIMPMLVGVLGLGARGLGCGGFWALHDRGGLRLVGIPV